jgi:hypothetical protein
LNTDLPAYGAPHTAARSPWRPLFGCDDRR